MKFNFNNNFQNNTNSDNQENNFQKKSFTKLFKIITFIIVIAIIIFSSAFQVNEQEKAIVLTLGKPTTTYGSGLHLKIPFLQTIEKVDTTIKGLTIGYDNDRSQQTIESESLMITGDYNFVNVDFFVEYRVYDPIKSLYSSYTPVKILKNVCQSSIRTIIGTSSVDDVLTTGKAEIQSKTKEHIIKKLEQYDIGIQILNVTIQDAEPPTQQVMEAFKHVETAKQSKETAINNANKYRNEKLPEARANVDKIIQDAEGKKQERINEAIGQVARFNKMYEEYAKNPEITKKRLYFETMEQIIPDLEVIIDDGTGNTQKILPLKPFDNSKKGDN